MSKHGIYIIKNNINNKSYIGKDIRLNKRWSVHRGKLRKNIHPNKNLQEDWNYFGEINFSYNILEMCDKESLSKKESEHIKNNNSKYPYGYNMTEGKGSLGVSRTIETRNKISNTLKGRKHSKERVENIKKAVKGKQPFGINDSMFGTKRKGSSSIYFGVYIKRTKNGVRWESWVRVNKKIIYIKSSKNEKLCAKAYDEYVIKNNLPNPLNFYKQKIY